ncbi:uncharacterized protein METZ01_LOCUS410104, partial [marine metagenome]
MSLAAKPEPTGQPSTGPLNIYFPMAVGVPPVALPRMVSSRINTTFEKPSHPPTPNAPASTS